MCTLIAGIDPLGSGSLVLAVNRDEDPRRPSLPPGALSDHPRVVGGRDARAGGTWLAVRGREAAVAILNRRPRGALTGGPATRSRGLLALDVAAVPPGAGGVSEAAFVLLGRRVTEAPYAPFALAWLSPGSSWIATHEPGNALVRARLEPGWHVLTHEDLDDPNEPRTARLSALLRQQEVRSLDDVEARLLELLSLHDGPRPGEDGPQPPVCLHAGRMVTVSSAVVSFAAGRIRYRHVEGRPCTERPMDYTHLLDESPIHPETA